jgi:hypothetical protein
VSYTPIKPMILEPDNMGTARLCVGGSGLTDDPSLVSEVLNEGGGVLGPGSSDAPSVIGFHVDEGGGEAVAVSLDLDTALEFALRLVQQVEWALDMLDDGD